MSTTLTENLSETVEIKREIVLESNLILNKIEELLENPCVNPSSPGTENIKDSLDMEEGDNTNRCSQTSVRTSEIETQTDVSRSEITSLCSRHEFVSTEGKVSNETPDLCKNCSKSMLSYIVSIQKFLEGLSKDISKQVDPLTGCFKCVEEKLNIPEKHCHTCNKTVYRKTKVNKNMDVSISNKFERRNLNVHETARNKLRISSSERDSTSCSSSEYSTGIVNYRNISHLSRDQIQNSDQFNQYSNDRSSNFARQNTSSDGQMQDDYNRQHYSEYSESSYVDRTSQQFDARSNEFQQITIDEQHHSRSLTTAVYTNENQQGNDTTNEIRDQNNGQRDSTRNTENQMRFTSDIQPRDVPLTSRHNSAIDRYEDSVDHDFKGSIPSQNFLSKDSDGILSTLHQVECGLKNISKNPSVWEHIAAINQNEQNVRHFDEAFVTIARNNAEVLGALVLGASLLLCGTSKTLCVLVHDNVNADFIAPLSSMFHDVLPTRSLDSVGTTKLNLLDQPELGISFAKLNVWRLTQFSKCVYLNPDTMVIQNCDELFYCEELSAVPDIGWPDCFNSAVFVFRPSLQTFAALLEFAAKQGSYEGGEQGVLNSYFDTWSCDIHKKLSFIYNLMANVNYTYTPAFKQFGRNIKVVQFFGAMKPWHVKFFSDSGQIAHPSAVHPTYVQFVHIWLNVYRISVLPLLSQEIQSFAMSQDSLTASEILRFFPSSVESDADFLLSPPSARTILYEQYNETNSDAPTVAEKLHLPNYLNKEFNMPPVLQQVTASNENFASEEPQVIRKLDSISETEDTMDDDSVGSSMEPSLKMTLKPESLIPGSEVGDYQGMIAWEQGRQGSVSSDTIIERLSYLIDKV